MSEDVSQDTPEGVRWHRQALTVSDMEELRLPYYAHRVYGWVKLRVRVRVRLELGLVLWMGYAKLLQ